MSKICPGQISVRLGKAKLSNLASIHVFQTGSFSTRSCSAFNCACYQATQRSRKGHTAPGFFDIPVVVGLSVAAAWCLWAAGSYFVVGNCMVSIAMKAVDEKRELSADEVRKIDRLSEWWMFGPAIGVKMPSKSRTHGAISATPYLRYFRLTVLQDMKNSPQRNNRVSLYDISQQELIEFGMYHLDLGWPTLLLALAPSRQR
jgi:hypothetical protein